MTYGLPFRFTFCHKQAGDDPVKTASTLLEADEIGALKICTPLVKTEPPTVPWNKKFLTLPIITMLHAIGI